MRNRRIVHALVSTADVEQKAVTEDGVDNALEDDEEILHFFWCDQDGDGIRDGRHYESMW